MRLHSYSEQFGMYILFPIGIMYYFGTNLDDRFAVHGFWPSEEQTHKIPTEKDEIAQELERLKQRRLAHRQKRLETEALLNPINDRGLEDLRTASPSILDEIKNKGSAWSVAGREGPL
ncbi:hypothetical protein K402DRAFT_325411 [Aulographum hederae CBS 113979]|uniref:Mitochondrial cytochrome c oxidase assembly factor n=1 Tax=Aulographum hederae CBS 113979 TaxID=1176131 RepID=A0A6G1HAM7_9PEZI|nr:hypothetical protein K402DRAFT_325411 [Aulographum hederae CBS 113979]